MPLLVDGECRVPIMRALRAFEGEIYRLAASLERASVPLWRNW